MGSKDIQEELKKLDDHIKGLKKKAYNDFALKSSWGEKIGDLTSKIAYQDERIALIQRLSVSVDHGR